MSAPVMQTPLSPIDRTVIARAAAILRDGGLVALPTETVYGLGANALDVAAVRRIYEAKGRPSFNPLIVHVCDVAQARCLAAVWSETAERLASHFWPGPLTLVVPKRPSVPDEVTAGLPAVGLRMPAHPVTLAILREAGVPIAAPSANRYTELSPTTAAHVAASLGDRVDLIVDAGPSTVGIESTVVDLTGERPVILRPGGLSRPELEAIAGPFAEPRVAHDHDSPRLSPGLVERHYAPRAPLTIMPTDVLEHEARTSSDARLGIVAWEGMAIAPSANLLIERLPADAAGFARGLYAALHALDARGAERILAPEVPPGAAWDGVRDRLARATHR